MDNETTTPVETTQAQPTQTPVSPTSTAPTETANPTNPTTPSPTPTKASNWLIDIGEDEALKPVLGEDGKPLLAGKYKDVPELEKAYTELQSKFSRLTQVPESYDVAATLKEHQLTWKDAGQEAAVTGAFKDLRLSNEQAAGVLKMYKEAMTDVLSQYGPPVDPGFEMETLKRNWGGQFDSRMAALKDFAKTLPMEVRAPLARTAAGADVMWTLYQSKLSPTVVKDTKAKTNDYQSMQSELLSLYGNKDYNTNPKTQARIKELSGAIAAMQQGALG